MMRQRQIRTLAAAVLPLVYCLASVSPAGAWTQSANAFPNDPGTCNNTADYPCTRWRKTSDNLSIDLYVYLDPSLSRENINLVDDMIDSVIPAWNGIAARNPHMIACTYSCGEHMAVYTVTDLPTGQYGAMEGDRTAGAPAFFTDVRVRMNVNVTWNRSYVYGPLVADARAALSHEVGHGQGLGHTGISPAIMRATVASSYWRPQSNDVSGIRAIYGAYP